MATLCAVTIGIVEITAIYNIQVLGLNGVYLMISTLKYLPRVLML